MIQFKIFRWYFLQYFVNMNNKIFLKSGLIPNSENSDQNSLGEIHQGPHKDSDVDTLVVH